MPEPEASRVAIYTRISADPTNDRKGVLRQQHNARKRAKDQDWTVHGVYEDDDTSQWAKAPRPDYDRMINDLKAGLFHTIIVSEVERLYRVPRELEDLIDIAENQLVVLDNMKGQPIDLTTVDGRMLARMLVTMSRREVESMSYRIGKRMAELAEAGKVKGGGKRRFGYGDPNVGPCVGHENEPCDPPRQHQTRDMMARAYEPERQLILEAMDRFLAGESKYAIASDWNRQAIPTPTGRGRWHGNNVGRIISSPYIAGLAVHRREVLWDVETEWEPIIDVATHKLIVATVENRKGRFTGRTVSTNLLTGILECRECGTRMGGGRQGLRKGYAERDRAYQCQIARGGCGGVTIKAEPVDERVAEWIFEVLDSPDFIQALKAASGDTARESELLRASEAARHAIQGLAEEKDDGLITDSEYRRRRQRQQDRIDQAEQELKARPNGTALATLPVDLHSEWETWPLSRRVEIVKALLEKVIVRPAVKGRNKVDLDRLEPVWKV